MWVLKLRLKHDCIIGNRCIRFRCRSLGYPLDSFVEGNKTYFLHLENLYGRNEDVRSFIVDLKRDKHVKNIEISNNSVFFTYQSTKSRMPSQAYLKKVIHVKPVFVDEKGYETWEVASWNRSNINNFIKAIKESTNDLEYFEILSLKRSKLTSIYFPQILPNLTDNQRIAIQLAIKNNYYDYPRQIELKDLAKMMKISLSTYREHLRIAEKKFFME